jgi:hypothetical protein
LDYVGSESLGAHKKSTLASALPFKDGGREKVGLARAWRAKEIEGVTVRPRGCRLSQETIGDL